MLGEPFANSIPKVSQAVSLTQVQFTLAGLAVVAVVILGWLLFVRIRRQQNSGLNLLLRELSEETLSNCFIPDGVGGEIHIDYLLLTKHGLLLLETQDFSGLIFAGDRLDTWSATSKQGRITFENPIPVLQQRATAVALLSQDAPLEARVLFTNTVTFPKGHPKAVSTVAGLLDEFNGIETGRQAAADASLYTAWDNIKAKASYS